MSRFIVLTFAVMFWGFYELSGGSDFEPGAYMAARAEAESAEETQVAEAETAAAAEEVSRADTGGLANLVTPAAAHASTAGVAASATNYAPELGNLRLTSREVPEAAKPDAKATADIDEVNGSVTPVARPEQVDESRDIRAVSGSRVNMRTGPGTNYSVIAQLGDGDEVEVLRSQGGWLKLRTIETKRIGWMADFLVTASR